MQQNDKVHRHKRKSLSLFLSGYIQLQSVVSSITSWKHTVQAVPSKKRKTSGRKEERKTRWKRREEEKRDGRSLCKRGRNRHGRKEEIKNGRMRYGRKEERKKERMKEKEKETEREEEKEEQKIKKAAQEMCRPLQTHSLA